MAQAERVVILLPNEVKKQLKQKADEKNLSMSTYVKLLVTEDLRNEKKWEKGIWAHKKSESNGIGVPLPHTVMNSVQLR